MHCTDGFLVRDNKIVAQHHDNSLQNFSDLALRPDGRGKLFLPRHNLRARLIPMQLQNKIKKREKTQSSHRQEYEKEPLQLYELRMGRRYFEKARI